MQSEPDSERTWLLATLQFLLNFQEQGLDRCNCLLRKRFDRLERWNSRRPIQFNHAMIMNGSGVAFEAGFHWLGPRHVFHKRFAIFRFDSDSILWLLAKPPVPGAKLPNGDPVVFVQIFEFAKQCVVARMEAKTAAMLIKS